MHVKCPLPCPDLSSVHCLQAATLLGAPSSSNFSNAMPDCAISRTAAVAAAGITVLWRGAAIGNCHRLQMRRAVLLKAFAAALPFVS
jgi:hypothetical protein